jgi:hypothetical protein
MLAWKNILIAVVSSPFSPRSEMQRGFAPRVLRVDIGTVLEKKLGHLRQPTAYRQM